MEPIYIDSLPILHGRGRAVVFDKFGTEETHDSGESFEPVYGSKEANGFDLRTPGGFTLRQGGIAEVDFGFATALPDGFGMLLLPRSGQGTKGVSVANTIGLIDQDYRGRIKATMYLRDNATVPHMHFARGDRVAQAIIVPIARVREFTEVQELPPTKRGSGGFESTGRS